MSKPYSVLLKEIQVLQAHADAVKAREIGGVVAQIKEAMKAYSITIAELCNDQSLPSARPVKYRDESGNIWGGRGPRPLWLRTALKNGKALGDFEA